MSHELRPIEMDMPETDRVFLRRLADEHSEIAALPVHRQTIEGWKRLNRLESGKSTVWINEIPWHEMDVDGEYVKKPGIRRCLVSGIGAE
jgi:hypothetical protein